MNTQKASKREVDALIESAEELGCDRLTIITHHDTATITRGKYTVHILPVLSWQNEIEL